MGTALTGTTPQDTYDSLIKVTDNGPLSGSLKVLSDGLGNDSTLSLSTAAASIAGTLAVTGNATFDTNTLFVDAAANEVGIGTTAPSSKLHLSGASAIFQVTDSNKITNNSLHISAVSQTAWGIGTDVSGTFTGNKLAITDAGNVGIGTSEPAYKLQVSGASPAISLNRASGNQPKLVFTASGTDYSSIIADASNGQSQFSIGPEIGWGGSHVFITNTVERVRVTDNGLTFNGDTAAANALDDYEEGTWTMGVSFGGASVGVTASQNTGTYTKIGRQVTVNGLLALTSKGSSTSTARITGLPFTIANSTSNYAAVSIWFNKVSFVGQFSAIGTVNETRIELWDTSSLGVITALTAAEFANDSEIMVNFTYFV